MVVLRPKCSACPAGPAEVIEQKAGQDGSTSYYVHYIDCKDFFPLFSRVSAESCALPQASDASSSIVVVLNTR